MLIKTISQHDCVSNSNVVTYEGKVYMYKCEVCGYIWFMNL